MNHFFPFGKYKTISVSQVALGLQKSGKGSVGYPYLVWFHSEVESISTGLKRDLQRHRDILNSFPSTQPCYSCEDPAPSLIAGIYDHDGGFFFNSPIHVYCRSDDCTTYIQANRYALLPIGFDGLLQVHRHKTLQKVSHETLRSIAGFDATKITERTAVEFISSLEEKIKHT